MPVLYVDDRGEFGAREVRAQSRSLLLQQPIVAREIHGDPLAPIVASGIDEGEHLRLNRDRDFFAHARFGAGREGRVRCRSFLFYHVAPPIV